MYFYSGYFGNAKSRVRILRRLPIPTLKMDVLSIRAYQRQTDNSTKVMTSFLEFFINDKSLSELLDSRFYENGSVLDNWIGVLGWMKNTPAEIVKIKQLMRMHVTDSDIRRIFPNNSTDNEFKNYLQQYRNELANPCVILYCCAQCGDYDCGGIAALLEEEGQTIRWKMGDGKDGLVFTFAKHQYLDVFSERLNDLENRGG